ncbi:MAG: cell division protein FtsZ [Elusimicrobia bacterium]|nr:cell division protein FtsZ [Elusimicrobiota bacterium]
MKYTFKRSHAVIKVVGVGGAGGNAINRMIESGIRGVDFIAMNTDAQDLERNRAPYKLQLGQQITRGLGVGGDPSKGRKSAEESQEQIKEAVSGTNLLFVTAGMGGGTGTGAAPYVAKVARELAGDDILIVGVVTKPFEGEGEYKAKLAEDGVRELKQYADSWLIVPNENIFDVIDRSTTTETAFKRADDVLRQAIKGISEIITTPGRMNVDFNDVKRIMTKSGEALIGIGEMSGENRHMEAAKKAIEAPMLENANLEGSRGLILHFLADEKLTMYEMEEAAKFIQQKASRDAVIKYGQVVDRGMGDSLRLTVMATGFSHEKSMARKKRLPLSPNMDELSDVTIPAEPIGSDVHEMDQDLVNKPAFLRRKGFRK